MDNAKPPLEKGKAALGSTPTRFITESQSSVTDFKGRRILRLHLAPVIDACGSDVGMAEPFLDLGDVGVVVEGVGGGGGAQRMSADRETEGQGVAAHEFVGAVGGDRVVLA